MSAQSKRNLRAGYLVASPARKGCGVVLKYSAGGVVVLWSQSGFKRNGGLSIVRGLAAQFLSLQVIKPQSKLDAAITLMEQQQAHSTIDTQNHEIINKGTHLNG